MSLPTCYTGKTHVRNANIYFVYERYGNQVILPMEVFLNLETCIVLPVEDEGLQLIWNLSHLRMKGEVNLYMTERQLSSGSPVRLRPQYVFLELDATIEMKSSMEIQLDLHLSMTLSLQSPLKVSISDPLRLCSEFPVFVEFNLENNEDCPVKKGVKLFFSDTIEVPEPHPMTQVFVPIKKNPINYLMISPNGEVLSSEPRPFHARLRGQASSEPRPFHATLF